MGRRGRWFISIKRVFSPDSQDKKSRQRRRMTCGFGACARPSIEETTEDGAAETAVVNPAPPPAPAAAVKASAQEEVKLVDAENEQNKHVYSVAIASAVAAEAAVVAAKAAAEVVRLTSSRMLSLKSREDAAAVKIQTAFRGYMARRALRALRGLVRLKSLLNSDAAKSQTMNTLRCMQTLARVQSQIRSRRMRMIEENQALQQQLQLKREREIEKLRMGENWDDSFRSKEQIEASLLSKQEAALRRERALAYAFSHQWRSSSRSVNSMFMDPSNPQWGWSWLERWRAARPWENTNVAGSEHASGKSIGIGGEITKSYACRDSISDRTSHASRKSSHQTSRQSPSTPPSKASSVTSRARNPSPRACCYPLEDDSRSMFSMQSEKYRRHSIAGSSVRDEDSLASTPALPSYMAPTQSAKAKSRFHSPSIEGIEIPDSVSVDSVKKRLSFPADKNTLPSPLTIRRHSGPPKVDITSLKEVTIPVEAQ